MRTLSREQRVEFIRTVGPIINVERGAHGIAVTAPIIAQMILESGWGQSRLAQEHNNYFGVMESRTDTEFRKYADMRDGIRGYFEVISMPRYANLKNVTDDETYIDRIIADGYCTITGYKDELMSLIRNYDLRSYGSRVTMSIGALVKDICGGRYGNGEERRANLRKMGWSDADIDEIQYRVNERCRTGR